MPSEFIPEYLLSFSLNQAINKTILFTLKNLNNKVTKLPIQRYGNVSLGLKIC